MMAHGAHTGRQPLRWQRGIGAIGAAGVIGLAAAYWLTCEPAPRMRVLWRLDVAPQRQAALEQKYLLRNRRDQLPEGSFAYDLLDTSPANIKALVEDPAILDTNDIERHTWVVPFDAEYGSEWMWIAHRTPGLRDARTRALLLVVLTMMTFGGFARDGLRVWRVVRRAWDALEQASRS